MADTVEDERRWQEAFTVLADDRSSAARSALGPAQRRVGILTAVLVVGALAVGIVVAVFLVGFPAPDSDPPVWRTVVGAVLNLLGVVLLIVHFVRRFRQGRFTEDWRAPVLVLTRPQRRSLLRGVRGKAPVDPRVLPLARDVAARRVRGSQLLLLVALLVQQTGQVLTLDSAGYAAFYVSLLGLYLVVGAWTLWDVRRAARFLRAHPA